MNWGFSPFGTKHACILLVLYTSVAAEGTQHLTSSNYEGEKNFSSQEKQQKKWISCDYWLNNRLTVVDNNSRDIRKFQFLLTVDIARILFTPSPARKNLQAIGVNF